jgi:tetratricopeptide (TPR) repeat protein
VIRRTFLLPVLLILAACAGAPPQPNSPGGTSAQSSAAPELKLPEEAVQFVEGMLPALQRMSAKGVGDVRPALDNALKQRAQQPRIRHGDRSRARSLSREAQRLLKAGEIDASITGLHAALSADPADVDAANALGFALLIAERYRESRRFLLLTLAQDPYRSKAWLSLGEVFAALQQKSSAIAAFSNAYDLSRDREKTLQQFHDILREPSTPAAGDWVAEMLRLRHLPLPTPTH